MHVSTDCTYGGSPRSHVARPFSSLLAGCAICSLHRAEIVMEGVMEGVVNTGVERVIERES